MSEHDEDLPFGGILEDTEQAETEEPKQPTKRLGLSDVIEQVKNMEKTINSLQDEVNQLKEQSEIKNELISNQQEIIKILKGS